MCYIKTRSVYMQYLQYDNLVDIPTINLISTSVPRDIRINSRLLVSTILVLVSLLVLISLLVSKPFLFLVTKSKKPNICQMLPLAEKWQLLPWPNLVLVQMLLPSKLALFQAKMEKLITLAVVKSGFQMVVLPMSTPVSLRFLDSSIFLSSFLLAF